MGAYELLPLIVSHWLRFTTRLFVLAEAGYHRRPMSRTTNRETAPVEAGSIDRRLARLSDSSGLVRVVPHLAPETLHQLVRHKGLDACGELLAAATPAQLTALLDIDLWQHPQPGHDDRFDVDRFGEWLDVLVDMDVDAAARMVAALDPQVVIEGLSRYIRVFDPGTFEPVESSDDEARDRNEMMDSEGDSNLLESEVGGYLVRARRTDAWDAIVSLLVTLDADHHEEFHRVMRGCQQLSYSRPEVDGLDDLLPRSEQHLHDLAVEREQRRSRRGYATPADARAFLEMARRSRSTPDSSAPAKAATTNPIARAYFRAAEEEAAAPHGDSPTVPVPDGDTVAAVNAVAELLAEAGVMPERPRALLGSAGDEDPSSVRVPLLKRLMEGARQQDETAYLTRTRELAFLANTLLAGASVQSRPFTPSEASEAAASVCNLGLECRAEGPGGASAPGVVGSDLSDDRFLLDHDLVTAFEAGWSVLYEEVSLFAADEILSALTDLHTIDADINRGLRLLRRRLAAAREAGTPWIARSAADVLAMLDATAWIGVLGLLDECPVLPAAVTAILERQTEPVSPNAFQFISTRARIGDVHAFVRTLPSVLSS